MRKLPIILLLLAFLGLGTGAIEFLHNLEAHDTEATHDHSSCDFHLALSAPLLLATSTTALPTHGDLIALTNLTLPSPISQHTPTRIDCRGPPTC